MFENHQEPSSPYYLWELQKQIGFELGRDYFTQEDCGAEDNAIQFAKLLLEIGLYNEAVEEL